MGNVFIKNAFFWQLSKSVEMKMLTNFLVNLALMVAMLVKLFLFLIASKTSPVSSLKVSFSSSNYALCYKIFFFNSFTFLFFLFFSCAIANLFKCEMQTSFPGLFWLLSAHLRPFEILRGVPLPILSYLKI